MTPQPAPARRALGPCIGQALFGVVFVLAGALLGLSARAANIAALDCSPSVVSGGSGDSVVCTVRLALPAPPGGSSVDIRNSLGELAASVTRVSVPAGHRRASFSVATNARYRAYSGLPFTVVISAVSSNVSSTTQSTTASATLQVTAPPPPADFSSGVAPGARFQWQGNICGRMGPVGGSAEILYRCTPAVGDQFGSCTFAQECAIGCQRTPPAGVTFSDRCATGGPNPVALAQDRVVSGKRVRAAIVTPASVRSTSAQALPGAISNQGLPGAIDGISVNASVFPQGGGITIEPGRRGARFDVATSYVPQATFIDVVGYWSNAADSARMVITSGRSGHAWLAIVPPEPAPALPVPTLGDFTVTGTNPVVGGEPSLGQIDVSGITSAGGPTIALTSSHPQIVSVPATFTLPASSQLGQQVAITTEPPDVDTVVTITASDGRYTFSDTLTVTASATALLQSLSIQPARVVGGASAVGAVQLSRPAPAGGALVILSTPLPEVAEVPPSVLVRAGATRAQFIIATRAVGEAFYVNVFAELDGTQQQSLLIVTPP